jgi:hypothetical protein
VTTERRHRRAQPVRRLLAKRRQLACLSVGTGFRCNGIFFRYIPLGGSMLGNTEATGFPDFLKGLAALIDGKQLISPRLPQFRAVGSLECREIFRAITKRPGLVE